MESDVYRFVSKVSTVLPKRKAVIEASHMFVVKIHLHKTQHAGQPIAKSCGRMS